jgi:hypothetical protein
MPQNPTKSAPKTRGNKPHQDVIFGRIGGAVTEPEVEEWRGWTRLGLLWHL